jgi:hypothetical protein
MTLGLIPWKELNEVTRSDDLEVIEDAWDNLSQTDKVDIFNSLRFPKRNIHVAAQLLAKLKNRAHRFPSLTATDVLTNTEAIGVIATEYNRGGFDTPTATMSVNSNGRWVRDYVADPSAIGLETFFP